ncbi:hypothetical protein AACH06_23885 [Ideonella sp. DXS29W]|uniref:HAF repeat-containing protein n=1 Tax=Ideonella lacteola TaxID=2984193 RepID=A0ABU9BV90_9BURK
MNHSATQLLRRNRKTPRTMQCHFKSLAAEMQKRRVPTLKLRSSVAAVAILAGSTGAMSAPPSYRIEPVGKSGGIQSQVIVSITDQGHILGCGKKLKSDKRVNYLKLSGGKAEPLQETGVYCGIGQANDAGEVISNSYQVPFSGVQAALWTSDGVPHDLRDLAGCDPGSGSASVGGLNQAGQAAFVVDCRFNGQDKETGVLWRGGSRTFLEGAYPYVNDINSQGDVIGSAVQPDGKRNVVLWKADGSAQVFLPPGGGDSYAISLNDAGQILAKVAPTGGQFAGVVFDGGAMRSLPACGRHAVEPVEITNDGLIAVTYGGSREYAHTGLVQDNQCYPLESLLDASGADWTGLLVTAMNNLGVLSGFGYYKGLKRNWVATPVAR